MIRQFAQFSIPHVITDLLHALAGAYEADLPTLQKSGCAINQGTIAIALQCQPLTLWTREFA